MKKSKCLKWVVIGYLIVAIVSYISMARIEKLESAEDIVNYNKNIVMNVR